MIRPVGARTQRAKRALEVTLVARRSGLLRVLRELSVWGSRPATRDGAREFREALEELGTTYIKLGQLLSSRPDLLPDVYIEELGRLVDEVPPVPFAELEPVIRGAFGDVFTSIDPNPIATASVAQIHPALLRSGQQVVVKVRRPGVVEQVDLDLDVIRATAGLLERRSESAQLLQLEALADELEVHLRAELDFREEAHNTELIARLVTDYERVVVPQVIRPHVTEEAMVLERIDGAKVGPDHGLASGEAAGLAREFFRAYVHQVTVEGVYHADPHRGNVLLTPDGRLVLLDFGLLGRLDDDTRRSFALLLLAVAQNRADDVADLILGLSLTTIGSDEPGFVHELRRKLPRYHWRPLEVMFRETERRLEPNAFFTYLFTQLDSASRLPRRVTQVVERLETGTLKVGVVPTDLADVEHVLRSVANRVGAALIVVGLLVSSALLARVHDLRWLAAACFVAATVLALYMVWKIIRTPGEL